MKTPLPPNDPTVSKVIIMLIREELKSRKLFEELHWLSYHNSFYKTDLVDLILLAMGVDPKASIERTLCHTLLDQHSQRVINNATELQDEARRVYDKLVKHTLQLGYMKDPKFQTDTLESNSKSFNAGPTQN